MITLGDGIAIAAIGGVIIAAILRIPMKNKTCYVRKIDFEKHVDKAMTKEMWALKQETVNVKLTVICDDIKALFKQMQELNNFLRGHFDDSDKNKRTGK